MSEETGLSCEQELRREKVRGSKLCGLDYIELEDKLQFKVYFLGKAPEGWEKPDKQKEIVRNFRIDGGRRIRNIQITELEVHAEPDDNEDDYMNITVDKRGDFSTYTLSVVEVDQHGQQTDKPHHLFDPRYASVEFDFNAGGPTELDCQVNAVSELRELDEPEINYLAKDYASFRQLILDRLAVILPGWQERHVPDIGVVMVEVLAYVGDYLSYYQDAVATEAYLDTARQRISVRRHARLIDYPMHEGCNARAWVTVWVASDLPPFKPDDFYFTTDPGLRGGGTVHKPEELPQGLRRPYVVFEPLLEDPNVKLNFYEAHNEIKIYTWENTQYHLAKGATSATLLDHEKGNQSETKDDSDQKKQATTTGDPYDSTHNPQGSAPDVEYKLKLEERDIVIFEEVQGPKTGLPEDADPSRRHAVRLTKVTKAIDPLRGNLVVEIEWGAEDALPFSLCLSSIKEDDCSVIQNVTVVRGNVILVDHGEHKEDKLGPVPTIEFKPSCDPFDIQQITKLPGKFAPHLERSDLSFSEPLVSHSSKRRHRWRKTKQKPASAVLNQDVRHALPQVVLYGFPSAPDGFPAFKPDDLNDPESLVKELSMGTSGRSKYLRTFLSGETIKLIGEYHETNNLAADLRQHIIEDLMKLRQRWEPRRDLLESAPEDFHFVVEMDNQRGAHLRFGDGDLGRMPDPGTTFQAVYRVGDGLTGNVGAEMISQIVFRKNLPKGVEIRLRNPFAAAGGSAPEPIAEVKLFAPATFRKELQRAITADDYAAIVVRDFPDKVQWAVATLEWTASRYEVQVAIDPIGREGVDDSLLRTITQHLYHYRKIGHDISVVAAKYVAVKIALLVHVLPHYLRGHVESDLLDVLSNRILPDGRLGLFHPDNLTFGQNVYLSRVVATAQAVMGVESVEVKEFHRYGESQNEEIDKGVLALGPLEIAQLDNDSSVPENGILRLDLDGGR